MSRRYGRNQKRQHKEELARLMGEHANLAKAHALDGALISWQGKEIDKQKKMVSDIVKTIERICQYSAAIPPKTILGDYASAGDKRMRITTGKFSPTWPVDSQHLPVSTITENHVDIYALESFLEERRETFECAVHLVCSNGKHSAYMLSDNALMTIPEETLANRFVPEIATRLIRHMRGN